MIKKMNSHDFNNILEDAKDKINNISEKVSNIKNDIDKKLLIIKHESDYLNLVLNNLSYQNEINDNFYVMLNDYHKGLYESYCNLVHPYFKKEPMNIFNLKSINASTPYFRDEVLVSINDISTDYYKNILMADEHPDKEIFFEEFLHTNTLYETKDQSFVKNNNTLKLSIEIDQKKILGISKFNMIEIDPYLYQSFDIECIKIYGDNYETPVYTSNKLSKVGKTRIILDKKYDFKKVEFLITLKYTVDSNGKTVNPFGLKHIYFYEADFRNDSYLILEYKSNNYIDFIKNDIELVSPYGSFFSTIKEEGIKIYLENNNGILENEQEPSIEIKRPIARNVKTLYFKVPIGSNAISKIIGSEEINNTNYRDSLIAIKFFIENR